MRAWPQSVWFWTFVQTNTKVTKLFGERGLEHGFQAFAIVLGEVPKLYTPGSASFLQQDSSLFHSFMACTLRGFQLHGMQSLVHTDNVLDEWCDHMVSTGLILHSGCNQNSHCSQWESKECIIRPYNPRFHSPNHGSNVGSWLLSSTPLIFWGNLIPELLHNPT